MEEDESQKKKDTEIMSRVCQKGPGFLIHYYLGWEKDS